MGVPTDASTALFFALNRSVESTALACQSLTAELGWTVGLGGPKREDGL